ncbi:MAG: twitch domain-containing radical SAM protein [Bdellovibrionales bacterium]|nr:twitch domain-containing radical SAM protein [Bdellovibrionales bacterium]NQZ19216.1 twitch domain-containing radical SAM protein [Bdellovibrionales bacterium]
MKFSQNFCVLPFIGTCIEAGGRYKPCCKYQSWQSDKDAREVSLEELAQSPVYQKIRKDMLSDEFHSGCQRCWDDEKAGIPSLRIQSNEEHGALYTEDAKIKVVDFGFGNTCNAACIMCESSSSVKWTKFDEELSKIEGNPFSRKSYPKTLDQFNWSDEDLKSIEHIINAQNEVFASTEFKNFLVKIDETSDIEKKSIMISTNGSIWPDETIIEKLKRFKKCQIQISIDGLEGVNEYIRHPLKWDIVESLTKKWIALSEESNIKVTARCTISVYNMFNIIELKKWWDEVSLGRNMSFGHTWFPHYLSPLVFKNEAENEWEKQVKDIPAFKKLLNTKKNYQDLKPLFWDFTEKMDKMRETNMAQQLPELSSFFQGTMNA